MHLRTGLGIRGIKLRKTQDEGWALLSVLMIVGMISIAVITIISISRQNEFSSESVTAGAQAESESMSILSLVENQIQNDTSRPAQILVGGTDPMQSITQWLTYPASAPNSLQSELTSPIKILTGKLYGSGNLKSTYRISPIIGSNTQMQANGQTTETQKYNLIITTTDKVSGISRTVTHQLLMTAVTGTKYQEIKGWAIAGNDTYNTSYLIEGSFAISGNPVIQAPQYVDGTFACSGNAHIESSISINGSAAISGNPNFDQPIYINGNLDISGSPEIDTTIYVAGNLTMSGNPKGTGKICVTDINKVFTNKQKITVEVCPFPPMNPPNGSPQLSTSFSQLAVN